MVGVTLGGLNFHEDTALLYAPTRWVFPNGNLLTLTCVF